MVLAADDTPIVRGATTSTTSPPTTAPRPAPVPSAPPLAPTATPRGTVAGVAHVVVRDDNLWTIAAAQLAQHGLAHDTTAIARYWQRVINRNRAHLRSGDANLIFPGEVIWLPPLDPAG